MVEAYVELMRSAAVFGVGGLGPTEVVLVVILLVVGGYMAVAVAFSGLLSSQAQSRPASGRKSRISASARSEKPTQASPPRPADGCPSGYYLQWPLPAVLVLLILGLAGAAAGSGGSPEGFVVALFLNPILWAAAYSFWKIGNIRCPHCRKSFPIGDAAKHPVGSAITCSNCGNDFAKPAG